MRNLAINTKEFVALNYLGKVDVVDSQGHRTGESKINYGAEIVFKTHISGASGIAVLDSNGISIEYDKSFVLTYDLSYSILIPLLSRTAIPEAPLICVLKTISAP